MPEYRASHEAAHIAWIDHAKGFTMILVVMFYAAGWVEAAAGGQGWLGHVVAFAQPFRMPDFFFLSGVLLSLSIRRDWRTYLDRKVLHFAYFYVLWLAILLAFESPWIAARLGWARVPELYAASLFRPYGLLWFIYLLPVFFVATKLLRGAPAGLVWVAAAALQVTQPETGIKWLDKLTLYYVFFYSGYVLAPHAFRFAAAMRARPPLALAGLALWAIFNAYAVIAGYAALPGAPVVLGLIGAAAVIALAAVLSAARAAAPLAYCGRHTLPIYLAFYIPLVIGGKLALSSGWIRDPGTIALLATAAAVAGALLLHRLVRGTRLGFLFERPALFRLAPRRVLSAA